LTNKYIISGINGNVGSLLKNQLGYFSKYTPTLKVQDETVFIHLASKSEGTYQDIIKSNIDYLCEVIDFCKKNGIEKFIFFSAISIYTHEDLYSTSKLLGEKILKESGLKVLILRLPMILTRNRKNGILNRIMHKLEKNEEVLLHNADKNFNNFIGIDDLLVVIKNYSFEKNYENINLAANQELSLLEIVNYLKQQTNSSSKIKLFDQNAASFNIDIKQAKDSYNFIPNNTYTILSQWLEVRG